MKDSEGRRFIRKIIMSYMERNVDAKVDQGVEEAKRIYHASGIDETATVTLTFDMEISTDIFLALIEAECEQEN